MTTASCASTGASPTCSPCCSRSAPCRRAHRPDEATDGYWLIALARSERSGSSGAVAVGTARKNPVVDKQEARELAEGIANRLRRETYADLVDRFLDTPEVMEAVGATGTQYQVEVIAFWDDKKNRDLRVIVNIDDRRLRAFMPL